MREEVRMTLIAIDPGITTGVAIRVDTHTSSFETMYTTKVQSEYMTLVIHRPRDLWDIFDKHQPTCVIFENFQSAGLISKDGQATLRLIGGIEAVTYRLGIPTCLQFPQERYGMLPAAHAMLKATGRKFLIHEKDALAHLLLYEDRVARGVLEQITQRRRTNKVVI